MNSITIGFIGAILAIAFLGALTLVEFLVGGFGLTLIALVVAIYVGRKIYADLFGDL